MCSGLKLIHVSLEEAQNHVWHKTEGLNFTSLVVRRGQPFRLTLSFNGPYMSRKDDLILRIELGMSPHFWLYKVPLKKNLKLIFMNYLYFMSCFVLYHTMFILTDKKNCYNFAKLHLHKEASRYKILID